MIFFLEIFYVEIPKIISVIVVTLLHSDKPKLYFLSLTGRCLFLALFSMYIFSIKV